MGGLRLSTAPEAAPNLPYHSFVSFAGDSSGSGRVKSSMLVKRNGKWPVSPCDEAMMLMALLASACGLLGGRYCKQ